jgi:hypothetical protein
MDSYLCQFADVTLHEIRRLWKKKIFLSVSIMTDRCMQTPCAPESVVKFLEPSQGLGAASSTLKVFCVAKISNLRSALETAVRAWGIALYTSDEDHADAPEEPALKEFVKSRLERYSVEAALLEREGLQNHTQRLLKCRSVIWRPCCPYSVR